MASITKKLFGAGADAFLPLAVGAAGVVYYAMQAHAPHGPGVSAAKTREWEKHMQTGQLIAVAALSTGVLLFRFKGKRTS